MCVLMCVQSLSQGTKQDETGARDGTEESNRRWHWCYTERSVEPGMWESHSREEGPPALPPKIQIQITADIVSEQEDTESF